MSEPTNSRLEHFPINFFAMTMGVMGGSLACHAATPVFAPAGVASFAFLLLGLVLFALLLGIYLIKALRFPDAVRAEWHHPVKLAFFPTVPISLLLISAALVGTAPGIALVFWLLGAIGQGGLTIAVLSSWISHRDFAVGHLTPAWFIPAVGNVVVPLAGAQLGFLELSWMFFSGGLMFWIVLLTLVMNRMMFHDPIPAKLFPTLMILIAPPAVAFVAYYQLTGAMDSFARILLNIAYVFGILIAVQVPKLVKLPFALSFWALSFPVAALVVASFLYGQVTGSGAHDGVGLILLAVLGVLITGLLWRTALAVLKGEICKPE